VRFQVPQFLETEVKVVGPFTVQQFIWVALGVGLLMLTFRLFSGTLFFFVAIIILIFFGAMAFYRIDGMPLVQYISLAVGFLFGQKRYVFRKEERPDLDIQSLVQGTTKN
jgi:membrane protein implicated in regulation of membrane protease activity